MDEVKFNISNYGKCLCPVCPVQANSECIGLKKETWLEARKGMGRILKQYSQHPETYEMDMGAVAESETGHQQAFRKPEPEEMMELYCSKVVGRSNCDDLDDDKSCQCPTCTVWRSYALIGTYFCLK